MNLIGKLVGHYKRVIGYVARKLSRPRRLSLREAVNNNVRRKRGARWITPSTIQGSRAAALPNLSIVTVRDEWANAHHASFTDDGYPIALQAMHCTDAHISKFKLQDGVSIEEGIWVAEAWQGNYYHWLIRHLPKVILCEKAGITAPLILPDFCGMQEIIDRSLDVLGCRSDRRIYMDSDVIHIKKGIIVQLARFDSELIQLLADRLRVSSYEKELNGVFVSRSGASKRRIIEEDTLIENLRQYGIFPLNLEGLSFDEQREVMSRTKILVGMHGAGLTNMLFMPSHGIVVEILSGNKTTGSLFQSLAEVLGHYYVRISANPLNSQLGNVSDVKVDNQAVIHAIRRLRETIRAREYV